MSLHVPVKVPLPTLGTSANRYMICQTLAPLLFDIACFQASATRQGISHKRNVEFSSKKIVAPTCDDGKAKGAFCGTAMPLASNACEQALCVLMYMSNQGMPIWACVNIGRAQGWLSFWFTFKPPKTEPRKRTHLKSSEPFSELLSLWALAESASAFMKTFALRGPSLEADIFGRVGSRHVRGW